jgi:hypothetical protein
MSTKRKKLLHPNAGASYKKMATTAYIKRKIKMADWSNFLNMHVSRDLHQSINHKVPSRKALLF